MRTRIHVLLSGRRFSVVGGVAREEATVVRDASRRREENEADKRSRLASGELGLDISSMCDRLREKGLRYVDALDG